MRRVIGGLLGLTMFVLAAGCSPDSDVRGTPPPSQSRWVSPDEATSEYEEKARTLPLAPGWTWPREPFARSGPNGEPVKYERGLGANEAEFHWYCSWASTVFTSASLRLRGVALRNALRLRDTDYFKRGLNRRNERFVAAFLTKAQQGDLRGLRRDVEQNCPPAE